MREEKLTIGSNYLFGGYNWRVLDVQDGMALLLSENVLEKRGYHEPNVEITLENMMTSHSLNQYLKKGITWENSTLRQYLNNEFYNKFSSKEKTQIAETRLVNNNNPWYGTDGGNDTTDKIFLLSIEEVVKYFGDSGDLRNRKGWYFEDADVDDDDILDDDEYILEDGEYVLKDGKGGYINDNYNTNRIAKDTHGNASSWRLRSPGCRSDDVADVADDGPLDIKGFVMYADLVGVRPALWLIIDETLKKENGKRSTRKTR